MKYECKQINPLEEHRKWAEKQVEFKIKCTNEMKQYLENCMLYFEKKKCCDCGYFEEDEFGGDALIPYCTHKECKKNFKSPQGHICEGFI